MKAMKAKPKRILTLNKDMTYLERSRVAKHDGKKIFSSMSEAREVAKKFRKRFGPKTQGYACKYDEGGEGVHYHIGHYRRARILAKARRSMVEYKQDVE